MGKWLITAVVFLAGVFQGALAYGSQTLGVDGGLIEKAIRGKELIFERRYDEALKAFSEIEAAYPDSATGLFGQMAVRQVRMFENEDFRFKREYNDIEKKYDDFALRELRKGDIPSWELFVHGASDGMRGFFRGREGRWLDALMHGLHAMRMFKRLKWQEPSLVDTDFGFGMYKYWRSVFTSEIKFLPFFGDHREEGIRLIRKVAENGEFAKDLAVGGLVFVLSYEKRYDEALAAADRILAVYPENIIIKSLKGDILISKKKYDEALAIFQDIYGKNPEITTALFQQGRILFKKADYPGARKALEKFLGTGPEKEWGSSACYLLGMIAEAGNDKSGAVEYYKKSLKFYKNEAAKKRLSKLDN